jgi:hypothetical protein
VDQDKFTIDRQARLITTLREDYVVLQKVLAQAEAQNRKNRQAAEFYFELQKQILDNPILQSEWTRFCSFLKMATTDAPVQAPAEASDEGPGYEIPYIF